MDDFRDDLFLDLPDTDDYLNDFDDADDYKPLVLPPIRQQAAPQPSADQSEEMPKKTSKKPAGKRAIQPQKSGARQLNPATKKEAAAGTEKKSDKPAKKSAKPAKKSGKPAKKSDDSGKKPAKKKKTAPKPKQKNTASLSTWINRVQDAALDLSDQMLDWRDDMTERFNDMAADPTNESWAARMLRSSDDMISGIADQQRETDDLMVQEDPSLAALLQQQSPVQNTGEDSEFQRAEWIYSSQNHGSWQAAPGESDRYGVYGTEDDPYLAEEEDWRHSRKTRRPSVVLPPSEKYRKNAIKRARGQQYRLFLAVLAVVALMGVFLSRGDSSDLENRTLAEKPTISSQTVMDGTYFAQLDQWYSDTYPNRDLFAGLYDTLGNVFGFDYQQSTDTDQTLEDGELAE